MDMKSPFFNVYLCNVCKSKESFSRSKFCTGCTLVSYCSSEHQKIDWQNHKSICKAVRKLCYNSRGDDLYTAGLIPLLLHAPTNHMITSLGRVPTPIWIQVMKNVKLLLEKQLNRSLTLFEMHMVFYPKHCAVCFTRLNINKESVCTNCFGAAYCSQEHQASDNHKEVCSALQKALDMDLFMLNVNLESQEVHLMKPGQAIDLNRYDMRSFIANFVKPELKFEEEALFSYYYTSVLTFSYIVNRIPKFTLGKQLTLHVVGATIEEGRVMKYWENLLHLFPKVHILLIVHIGPCIGGYPTRLSLCNDCKNEKKSVELLFCPQRYHEYYNYQIVLKPDVIIAFNSGFYDDEPGYDLWGPSLPFFFKYENVPLIATDWSKPEAEADLKRLIGKDVVGDKKIGVLVKCEKNPFNNLRRNRCMDDIDSPVRIKNSYVSALMVESDQ